MKKIAFSIITLALASTAWAQTLDRSVRPKPGPAPEIKLGKTETFTLPNGLKVFVVENHKLPTIACSIQLDIYPELEGEMAGYRDIMGELLTSGTKTRNKEQLSREIDFIGASIDASDDGIEGSSLKKHQEKLLELMSDIAINANITQEELEKVKKRTLSGLEVAKNEPDQMLRNASAVINFGKKHPYGQIATEETVEKITLDRCRNYYSTYFRPNVGYMAIVGDITVAEVKPLIEKYFNNWQKATVPVTKYPTPKAPTETHVSFASRDAAVQSVINVTYPIDLKPGTPDVIKARVANTILGGGSQGRLFLNLREGHGWTYGSYSSINEDDLVGSFTAYAKCRNGVSDSSVAEIIAEMKKMRSEKIAPEALQSTITYLSGGFAIGLEDPNRVAQYAINIERYKMPKDYYQNYLKNLAAVKPEDVQLIAAKYIHPEQAHIVVVGNKKEVASKLGRFSKDGTVTYVDNYGRVQAATEQKAVPAGITAETIMKNYINAIGGEKAIMAVKDIKTISKGTVNVGGQELALTITEMRKDPSRMKITVEGMGMVLQKKVLNGDAGYEENQGAPTHVMDEAEVKDMKADADLYADLNPGKYGIKRTLNGMEKVNGADAYSIESVTATGKKATEYYDAATWLLIKQLSSEEGPTGAIVVTEEFSDYKEIPGSGGYKIPWTVKQSSGPQAVTAKVQTAEVNKNIPDSEFQ